MIARSWRVKYKLYKIMGKTETACLQNEVASELVQEITPA